MESTPYSLPSGKFRYESVKGFFLQDEADTDVESFDFVRACYDDGRYVWTDECVDEAQLRPS